MPSITVPDYSGGSLVNLVAELERRLTGRSLAPPLHDDLSDRIPPADTYVIVLFDGLGARQLAHPAAAGLSGSRSATIDAPFPATTTVSMATIATGRPPAQHGLIGYQLWMPDLDRVVNTIKWTTLWGDPVDYDTTDFLPSPNLWERLSAAGVEPITVQPGAFIGTPLSRLLYRGCRYEPAFTIDETIEATLQLAAEPRRLIFTYLPQVDFAAHVYGQEAPEYAAAVSTVADVWRRIALHLPGGVTMVGTADHGHVDIPKDRQIRIPGAAHADRIFYGDARAMFVKGEGASLAADLPATWVPIRDMDGWWGPGPRHPSFGARAPDGVLIADDGYMLLHRHSDDRMIGNHGALTDAERLVPLLVAR